MVTITEKLIKKGNKWMKGKKKNSVCNPTKKTLIM